MTNFEEFVNRCQVTGTPLLVKRRINHTGLEEVGQVARIHEGTVYIMVGTNMQMGKVNDRTYNALVVGEWVMTERQFHQMNHALNEGLIDEMLNLRSLPERLCFAAKILNRDFLVYKRLPSGSVINDVVRSTAENGWAFLKGREAGSVPLYSGTTQGKDFWYIDPKDDLIVEIETQLKEYFTVKAKKRFAKLLVMLPGSKVAVSRHLHLAARTDRVIGLILNSAHPVGDTVGYTEDPKTLELVWDHHMDLYTWDIVE